MGISSELYELYNFFTTFFNLRRKDDLELAEWLHSQFDYKDYDEGVLLQINKYDGRTINDYIQNQEK